MLKMLRKGGKGSGEYEIHVVVTADIQVFQLQAKQKKQKKNKKTGKNEKKITKKKRNKQNKTLSTRVTVKQGRRQQLQQQQRRRRRRRVGVESAKWSSDATQDPTPCRCLPSAFQAVQRCVRFACHLARQQRDGREGDGVQLWAWQQQHVKLTLRL